MEQCKAAETQTQSTGNAITAHLSNMLGLWMQFYIVY